MNDIKANFNEDAVARVCAKWLTERNERIEKQREELIVKKMSRRTWFGLGRYPTRDEAIKDLKDCGCSSPSPWWDVSNRGAYWADICREVLELCMCKEATNISLRGDALEFIVELLNKENENA